MATVASAGETPTTADQDRVLPILTIRNSVLFPHVAISVSIDRPESIAAVEAAMETEDKLLAVFAQHDAEARKPAAEHLYRVGTDAVIRQAAHTERGLQVIFLGLERIRLGEIEPGKPYLAAAVERLPTIPGDATETEALQRQLLDLATRIQQTVQAMPEVDMEEIVAHVEGPMHLVYLLASMVHLTLEKAQILLQLDSRLEAMKMLARYLSHELQVLELNQQMVTRARTEIDREQREYFLRQQLQTIREELGEGDGENAETADLRRRLDEAELPDLVHKECERALQRLSSLPAASPDFHLTRAYLETTLELPWVRATEDDLDLGHVRRVLDEDHYGLEDVKERILEHLAVLKLNPGAKAPILCFVGPSGVGKTSLGTSIARALGREFERLSLGGLHDEAELRGHRRTYVGAMPGRILQALRRAGVNNPLLLLDEVDKVGGQQFRGDPTAALLEILDPAQNHTFRDNYLGLPFDLSRVFFLTTANTLDTLPRPLLDRMEVLRLSGYSDEEKMEIARRYLLPRRRREAGLADDQLTVPDATLATMIRRYTREAGVRELERTLGRLTRKVALRCAEGRCDAVTVESSDLSDFLGPERFAADEIRSDLPVGVAAGLAWTGAGGEVLYIEAVLLPGEGEQLTLTGHLGEVMKESAQTARSLILSQGTALDLIADPGRTHIHVPAGAIPKDGPSAGVAMATVLASLYVDLPVSSDTAMTGEITLSGLVLPVGGVREKVLAARRAGLRRVILPQGNEKDIRKLSEGVREDLEIVFAGTVLEVLQAAIPGIDELLASASS
ncbi:MAG: endopeptidase La [Thermoanaerobaculia bacterium]